jgi:hypothetical protein
MLKRIMLALTFIATICVFGVGVTEKADAWDRWRRPFDAHYYGPPVYYDSYVPYRTYYRGYYGPRFYRPYYGYYGSHYGGPGYYYGPRSGISVSFGF